MKKIAGYWLLTRDNKIEGVEYLGLKAQYPLTAFKRLGYPDPQGAERLDIFLETFSGHSIQENNKVKKD